MGILVLAVNLLYTFVYGPLPPFSAVGNPVERSLSEVVQELREQIRWSRLDTAIKALRNTGLPQPN